MLLLAKYYQRRRRRAVARPMITGGLAGLLATLVVIDEAG